MCLYTSPSLHPEQPQPMQRICTGSPDIFEALGSLMSG